MEIIDKLLVKLLDAIKEKYDGIARVYKRHEIKFNFILKYGVNLSYDKAC